ncbi:MAG: SdpI family protein, partial [Thermaerobacter sp.]|nr:SdpI family protein [Thermaerobacter sp.]
GLTAAFIGATQAWVIGHALGWPVSSVRVVPILVGLLLLLLANVLPRVKPNWWIGVRTPWTLSNDAVWAKTHLWAGRLGVAAGLLLMLGGWMAPAQAALALITWVVAGWGSAVIVLSWIFFRINH